MEKSVDLFEICIAFCNTIWYNGSVKCTWNKVKNETNIKKHDISFELALKVFFDESRIEWYDEAHSINED